MTDQTLAGRYVSVIGPGTDPPAELLDAAFQIGMGIARRGAVVVTGGMGGVMQATAAGVRRAGGVSIALLPGSSRSEGSPEHTYALPTGLGELRNGLVVRAAEAVVAVGCSWGTLSEISLAIRTGVPLVHMFGWPDYRDRGTAASGPEEAVSAVESLLATP
ncbi:MAG: TIGR00725 family protein [Actinomycetota bacterium]